MGRNQKVSSESYRETPLKMAGRSVPPDIQPQEILNNNHGTQHTFVHTLWKKPSIVDSNLTGANKIPLFLPQLNTETT